jgi:hypothetical protein
VGFSMKRQTALIRDVLIEDHMAEADLVRAWTLTTVTLPDKDVISARLGRREAALRAFNRQSALPGRVAEGRVDDWEFDYGSVGLAVGEWCEPGPRLRVERAGPDRIRVVNETGGALEDATFAAGDRQWPVGPIPEGESFQYLRDGRPVSDIARQYYAESWVRPRTEREWAGYGRQLLIHLSLAPVPEASRHPRGFAAAMDARGWLAQGGGVLMGWCGGSPALEFSRAAGQRRVYRLVRAFTPDD